MTSSGIEPADIIKKGPNLQTSDIFISFKLQVGFNPFYLGLDNHHLLCSLLDRYVVNVQDLE